MENQFDAADFPEYNVDLFVIYTFNMKDTLEF